MIDHIGIAVSDAGRSRDFYDELLGAIGLRRLVTIPAADNESGGETHGYGRDDDAFFWIGDNERVGEGTHVAFRVENRAQVHALSCSGPACRWAGPWRAGPQAALRVKLLRCLHPEP
ncbi:VOC family protein [Sphingobium sp. Cam5-1]|uniref:VOC family protein n=1 Tax=Sphingobium sp. Cam5-1 TaxID=2789327 RepID=UPI001E48D72B|nr:VOC family protein [Sphingobium sp. Cam5-1]